MIVGSTGTRLDHTLANIHDMAMCLEKNIDCKIVNENNEIFLIDKTTYIEKSSKYKYVSLVPLTSNVTGLTLNGFKYNVTDFSLCVGKSRAISNVTIAEKAVIEIKTGVLIVIRSKD